MYLKCDIQPKIRLSSQQMKGKHFQCATWCICRCPCSLKRSWAKWSFKDPFQTEWFYDLWLPCGISPGCRIGVGGTLAPAPIPSHRDGVGCAGTTAGSMRRTTSSEPQVELEQRGRATLYSLPFYGIIPPVLQSYEWSESHYFLGCSLWQCGHIGEERQDWCHW